MPGDWTMSMTWMRMPGQSWPAAAAMFMAMWLAMMVAMMLPSAWPMFVQYHGALWVGIGYFLVWLALGLPVYIVGITLARAAMQSASISRMIPLLSSLTIILAGVSQFMPWKLAGLCRCRDPLHCLAPPADGDRTSLVKAGLRCGMSCASCCTGWMLILFVAGVMNLAAMGILTVLIALEKLMPRPERFVRLSGAAIVFAGIMMLSGWLLHR